MLRFSVLPLLTVAALTPAYLLFIRQCRYFAPAMLFTMTLLAAWAWTGTTRRARTAILAAGDSEGSPASATFFP